MLFSKFAPIVFIIARILLFLCNNVKILAVMRIICLVALALVVFGACKKESTPTPEPEVLTGWQTAELVVSQEPSVSNTLEAQLIAEFGEDYASRVSMLKLVGDVRATDFVTMYSFTHLDLSEVNIVGNVTVSTPSEGEPIVLTRGDAIPESAFSGKTEAPALKKLILNEDIVAIGQSAFEGCLSLDSIEFKEVVRPESTQTLQGNDSEIDGVTDFTIFDRAFYGCSALTYYQMTTGCVSVGESAFENCETLSSIEFKHLEPEGALSSNEWIGAEVIGENAFKACSTMTSVVLPPTLLQLGDGAFADCSGVKSFKTTWRADFKSMPAIVDGTLPSQFRLLAQGNIVSVAYDYISVEEGTDGLYNGTAGWNIYGLDSNPTNARSFDFFDLIVNEFGMLAQRLNNYGTTFSRVDNLVRISGSINAADLEAFNDTEYKYVDLTQTNLNAITVVTSSAMEALHLPTTVKHISSGALASYTSLNALYIYWESASDLPTIQAIPSTGKVASFLPDKFNILVGTAFIYMPADNFTDLQTPDYEAHIFNGVDIWKDYSYRPFL